VFDLRVPESLASLPGRVISLCPEDALPAKRTHAERLEQMREAQRQRSRENKRRLDRLSYARHREEILARRAERYRAKTIRKIVGGVNGW
jgi:hypothetical protein